LPEPNPKFTVIVVAYNAARTIRRCIETVLRQDYENKELIIVDGGSTDGTADILRGTADFISYWVSEPDTGIYNAMNKGVDRATGDWIIFLGADDFLFADDVLSRVARLLGIRNGLSRLVYGKVAVLDQDGNIISHWGEGSNQTLGLPHQATFHHKSFFEAHGRFDETFKIAGDHEMLLRELKHREAEFFPEVVVSGFSVGGVSTALDSAPKYWLEYARARRANDLFPYPPRWLRSFLTALFFRCWGVLCGNGSTAKLRDQYCSLRLKSPSGIEPKSRNHDPSRVSSFASANAKRCVAQTDSDSQRAEIDGRLSITPPHATTE
jgi:glycosyltransferase involved in cell wall biosynthesis